MANRRPPRGKARARRRSARAPLFERGTLGFSLETLTPWEFDETFGLRPLAGFDEAGRGPLAGPLVVCGLILDPFRQPPVKVSDSKTMSAAEREEAYAWIKEAALEIRVAVKSPRDVDELNPLVASLRGMEEAHGAMALKPRLSLIDGNALPFLPGEARAVIHGDEKSLAIAAASIVAKVTRDALMLAEHENYPQYGFDKHKGYATRAHLAVLAARGPSPIHRLSFKGVAPPPPPGPGGLF